MSRPVKFAVGSARSTIGNLQRWSAWCVIAALVGVGVATWPFAKTMTVAVPGFFSMYVAGMVVVNLLLAVLLLIKGASEQNDGTIRLGSAYLFVCLISVVHAASFPGGLMPAPLIGTEQTSIWIWCFWHIGFGLAILNYCRLARRQAPHHLSVLRSILAVAALTAGITFVATDCTAILPPLLKDGQFVYVWPSVVPWVAAALAIFAALASLVWHRAKTPEHLWLVVAMVASCLDVCLTTSGAGKYTVGWYVAKACSLATSLSVLISFIYDITCVYSEVAANNQALQTLARVDGLTGIANRRRFDEMLEAEFIWSCRKKLPLGLVLLDIDYFKSYNDCYGHLAGDECLRRVSTAVQKALWRPGDCAARYGGEEIAVLLAGVDLNGALLIAERIRLTVAALGIEHTLSDQRVVTVSAGAASLTPRRGDETAADLVAAADIALYKAKDGGRNQVCGSLPAEQVVTVAEHYDDGLSRSSL